LARGLTAKKSHPRRGRVIGPATGVCTKRMTLIVIPTTPAMPSRSTEYFDHDRDRANATIAQIKAAQIQAIADRDKGRENA
ncbi:MAG: hypothetical protein ABI693_13060, partial [Bryobacteraceae bacterium]